MKFFILLLAACLATGCGGRAKINDSDRRDAKLALASLEPTARAVQFEQTESDNTAHGSPASAIGIKLADETRTKYKASPIEPEVTKLCLALTAYWELPDGKGEKAKSAAADVEKAKADLQAVADGK